VRVILSRPALTPSTTLLEYVTKIKMESMTDQMDNFNDIDAIVFDDQN
jgi:hypothetical protein